MIKALQILFSARDAAAALYATPLIELAMQDTRFRVTVVAQEPAYSMLTRRGIPSIFMEAPAAHSPQESAAALLLAKTSKLIAAVQPDAIVAGLSSPGQGGVDEALLKVSRCPTFLLQDFWGECNRFFGRYPDVFLVLDTAAAELTRQRYEVECFIMGSPRHAGYQAMDLPAAKRSSQARLNVETESVIGWFGQSLHQVPGYADVMMHWVDAVKHLRARPTIVYKPHPRENALQRQQTMNILSRSSPKVCFLEEWSVEEALLACDCACSIMSNCLYDGAYLNFHSEAPLLSTVSVLTSEALLSNLSTQIAFEALPYTRLGLAETVLPQDNLVDSLTRALSRNGIEQAWHHAKNNLISPATAVIDTLSFIGDWVTNSRTCVS